MSVRVRNQIVVVAATDTDEKSVQFERQDKSLTSVIGTYDGEMSGHLTLAAGASYTLPMGKVVTGQLLYIESDQALTVKLDGEVTGHALSPTTAAKAKLFMHSSFTSAPVIVNGTANEATISYLLAGAKS